MTILKHGNLRDFLQKKLLKKLLKSWRYDCFENYAFFRCFPYFQKSAKIEKRIIFKKSYLNDFKSFFNNFFCKKSLRFPSFKIAVARRNPSYYSIFDNVLKIGKISKNRNF